jgi:hypothetical protein
VAGGYVAMIQFESSQTVKGTLFTFQLKVKDGAAMNATYSITGTPSIRIGSVNQTATVKKADVSIACTHEYDHKCDTSCNVCGATREVTHSWDNGKVTTEATCTTAGVKTYTCTTVGCGHTKTEDIKALDHSYDGGKVTKEATCTATGIKTYTCTRSGCGHKTEETIKVLDHSYDTGKITTQPTCTTAGEKTFTCTRSGCGHTIKESVKALDHSYDSGKITTQPTCTAAGVKTYTCTRSGCGHTRTESVKATGHTYDHACDPDCNTCQTVRLELVHDYSEAWHFDENGHWHACSRCGDALEMEPHVPGPEATETSDQICTTCGYVLEKAKEHVHTPTGDWLSDKDGHWHLCGCGEAMDADAHLWGAGVADYDKGVTVYTCTECGFSREEELKQEEKPTDATDPTTGTKEPTASDTPGEGEPHSLMWLLIVLCVIGVVLLGAIIFVIIGIAVSRKQTGRFTPKK